MPYQPPVGPLYQGEVVLAGCVHDGEPPLPCKVLDAHSEMSLNITLDLDIDEKGDLRAAFVPDASTPGSTITLRVLCDAETQTDDQYSGAGGQEVVAEEGAAVGCSLAEHEGGSEHEGMNSLALTLGTRRTSSVSSNVPASPAGASTFRFDPYALSFSPVCPFNSLPDGHVSDNRCNSLSATRLSPLAEEFKVLARSYDAFVADALLPGAESDGCRIGHAVLLSHGEPGTVLPADILSPLPLDVLAFAPAATGRGE